MPPQSCDASQTPSSKDECREQACVVWSAGPWSDCSVICGEGIQNREVLCRTIDSEVTNEELCSEILRPNDTRSCLRDKCIVGKT